MEKYLWICLAAVNVTSFVMCVYDKSAAKRGNRRISGKALFTVSVIGGAAGMLAGMLIVRHKTRHWYFMVFVPLLIVLHAAVLIMLL
jgi:uncharacterized membrane protein YsdA (DUF1294 family)